MAVALIVVSFLSTIISFIPFPWHYRTRNIPTMMMMIWIGQGNFFRGVSAIIWSGSVVRKNLVFCDIALSLQVASIWGMCACALCITRHLESVASPRYSSSGLNDPRNRKRFEILMCIILPWLYAAIHLIVQGHRFDLIEDIGCSYTVYWSWASIFLFYVPPLFLSLVNSIYAGLALRWFIQRRAQFRDLLNTSGITASRYIRLMGLSIAELLGSLILNAYVLAENAKAPLRPWISWQNVHSDFKRVAQFPLVIFTSKEKSVLYGSWAIYPISAVLFFAFFGFGQEAIAEYKKSYQWVRVHIFRRPAIEDNHTSGNLSLPSFVASGSMVSRTKGQLSTNDRSMTTSQKWDASLDLDDDSLYDADERRGRRSVALNDLESCGSGADEQSMNEKSYVASIATDNIPAPVLPPLPPMPAVPAPAVIHRVSLSRTSSIEESTIAPETPRAF